MLARSTYRKLVRRFRAFQDAHAALPLDAQVRHFLTALPASVAVQGWYALRDALGEAVPWATIPHPRYHRNEARLRSTVLGERDRARLGRGGLSPRDTALLGVLYVLRRAEAARLLWSEVDLSTGALYVACGKGGKAAWTVLPPNSVTALQVWQACASTGSLVFPGSDGQAVSPDTIGQWVRAAFARAGLAAPGRGAHALRRTFATEFLHRNPGALRQLQVLMRHSMLATTVLYDYPDPAAYQATMRALVL
jgi:integrase